MSEYEIIIIGSGAGGGTLAHALAPSGKKILIVERGEYLPREKANWNPAALFLESRYKTNEKWYDKKGKPFRPGMYYNVGGNTKVYGAALLRLRERDFEEVTHSEGISPAWPLKYEDFRPYYLEAEKLYHVRGERGADPLDPPDDSPYFYPALKHEEPLLTFFKKMQVMGYKPFPLPLGLRLKEKDRENSRCIRCDTCDGFPCLVDGKSDAEISCIKPALSHENVTLMTNAKAVRLETDPSGREITGVVVEREGREEKLRAKVYVLACGAVNSAALLLKSKNSSHPDGLANSSGLVGRNYMCHINSAILSIHTKPNHSKFQKTIGLNDFYFGAPDWEYPLGHIQLLGNLKKEMLKGKAPPFTPSYVLEKMAEHSIGWWLSSEDLPDPENRVTLTPSGEIALHYTLKNQEGHKRLIKKLKKIIRAIEPALILHEPMPIGAVAHQVGTCRFGKDPKTSVLDLNCKAHDLDNLYVVDGSFFPSSAAVNPGLTIMANA
ncbi:MAG: GMC oxidoreductase, partial [Chlamydiales bacterium]